MKIQLNGETKELNRTINLLELLKLFSLPTERIAIELNREVIRKRDWESINISDGDRLEVIHFVGGG